MTSGIRQSIGRLWSTAILLSGCLVAAPEALTAAAAEQPNVILILADDLGWADLPCYGNKFNQAPHLDRLAGEGVRFTQFYAGPVCSPTRANIQSGQNQARLGITQHIPGHRRPLARLIDPAVPLQMPLEIETIAERLSGAGYATGYFGKWHLGGDGYGPADQGWTTVLELRGHTAGSAAAGTQRRTADLLTEKAVEFIEANRQRPFLLQVSHIAVHIPLSTRPELLEKHQARPAAADYPSRPEYAALLEELDESVGGIVEAVDRLGLAERTLIVFVSDNGGLEHQQDGVVVTSNRPLRGEKGTLYEGGIRVPCIARWPGTIPRGAVCGAAVSTTDLYPTLLELGGAQPPPGQPLDGASLAGLLRDPAAAAARDTMYWHLPHYHHSTPASAIRRGDWKLIEFFEDGAVELYHLGDDPGEQRNLAAEQPQRAGELRGLLAAWRKQVGARMPQPNPDYDPARAQQLGGRRSDRSRP